MRVGEFEFYDYQENAIRAIGREFQSGHDRVLVECPTGGGKTIIAAGLADKISRRRKPDGSNKRVMLIMRGRQLVTQMSDVFTHAGLRHTVLMHDSGHKFDPNESIMICSKDTLESRLSTSLQLRDLSVDYGIVDEADIATSAKWQEILSLAERQIGLTATPITGSGKGLGNFYDSMIHVASVSELISQGRLVGVPDGKVFSPYNPDLKGISTSGGDFSTKPLSERMNTPELVGDQVAEWQKHGEDRPTLVCCVDKQHTRDSSDRFNAAGIPAAFIVDDTPQNERENAFNGIRNGTLKVLVNCAVLTRGFDLPELGCLVLAKPTKCYRVYIQMVGRVLRSHPSKTDAIVIDHGGCVWRHGWPSADREWSLDADTTIQQHQAKSKPRQERPERYCPRCSAIWKTGRKCPACGYARSTVGQPTVMADGTLVPIKKSNVGKKASSWTPKTLQQTWDKVVYSAAWASQPCKVANARFKKVTGMYPNEANVTPVFGWDQKDMMVAALIPKLRGQKKSLCTTSSRSNHD
jgi:DNA repair protein RadD